MLVTIHKVWVHEWVCWTPILGSCKGLQHYHYSTYLTNHYSTKSPSAAFARYCLVAVTNNATPLLPSWLPPPPSHDWLPISFGLCYITLAWIMQKILHCLSYLQQFLYCSVCVYCCREVFTVQVPRKSGPFLPPTLISQYAIANHAHHRICLIK